MDINELVLLIAFLLTCCWGVVVWQAIGLRRVLNSWAWTLIAAAFFVGGFRQVWGYIRLPATILQAQKQGVMPESLSGEQWFQVGMAFLMLTLIICGLDRLRKDLRNLGI